MPVSSVSIALLPSRRSPPTARPPLPGCRSPAGPTCHRGRCRWWRRHSWAAGSGSWPGPPWRSAGRSAPPRSPAAWRRSPARRPRCRPRRRRRRPRPDAAAGIGSRTTPWRSGTAENERWALEEHPGSAERCPPGHHPRLTPGACRIRAE